MNPFTPSRTQTPAMPLAQQAVQAYARAPETEGINWDLVKNHLPLLKSLVGRMRVYFPIQVETADLYSLGMAGLVGAAARFDGTRSPSFGAYAAHRIRGALLDELRRMDWMPRSERLLARELKDSIEILTQSLKRAPTEAEIADALGISIDDYRRRLDQARPLAFISLNQSAVGEENEGILMYEAFADANAPDVRDTCEQRESLVLLRKRIDEMDEMPKKVLILYYYKGLRLAEIAEALGLTESRICQIHTQAVIGLRAYFKKITAGETVQII